MALFSYDSVQVMASTQLNDLNWLSGDNSAYLEELYTRWRDHPDDVDPVWQEKFARLERLPSTSEPSSDTPVERSEASRQQVMVQQLVAAYRFLGARRALLDPLKRREAPYIPELDPQFYGLTSEDLSRVFHTTNTYFGRSSMPLNTLLGALRQTYCGSIGAEFMYISAPEQKRWWQERLESCRSKPQFEAARRVRFLETLSAAEGLERFLHTRYVGQKRFSLEGGESFITAMDALVHKASAMGVEQIVIGMAHRGRLNVLVNTMGKSPKELFAEFEGTAKSADLPAGDVKYHNGFSSDPIIDGRPVHLCLEFNPSHLEIVDPVVVGSVRARQDRLAAEGCPNPRDRVLGVMVHGDAAFAGQGIVMETLNLADTRGYGTGGTVHIVVNNQIGFTTSDPRDKGSMTYCTDPAKLIEAPVLHVNGDDPEAVVFATELALDYQRTFKQDVVVDIVCFRRLGHNEQDTPALTQPLMYKKINAHRGTRAVYADTLVRAQVLPFDEPQNMVERIKTRLRDGKLPLDMTLSAMPAKSTVQWVRFKDQIWTDQAATGVSERTLRTLGERITEVPDGFTPHPLLAKVIADRRAMAETGEHVDWGMAEHLAFATLLDEGFDVRITGEDSGRGTFSHRHAVWHDQKRERWDEGDYVPLNHLRDGQGHFTVIDSVLSENAVLGFEYGYASSAPDALVIWEAQFGDFANGAQVVIDQFISSGEAKWGRLSGLTLMLPHGYEGQGPEHSSARIERYLQLAADDNMQIVQPTNAKQIFHLLRRQLHRDLRKPLIIFTPKSLLRNKAAVSSLSELEAGAFEPVITDTSVAPEHVDRVILCSGKVYYDLVNKRRELGLGERVALVRVEELYPLPADRLEAVLSSFTAARSWVWCQDEPQNQGPWWYMAAELYRRLPAGVTLAYAGREASSSPACGYPAKHQAQLRALLEEAFADMPA